LSGCEKKAMPLKLIYRACRPRTFRETSPPPFFSRGLGGRTSIQLPKEHGGKSDFRTNHDVV